MKNSLFVTVLLVFCGCGIKETSKEVLNSARLPEPVYPEHEVAPGGNRVPVFSPDGKKVLFCSSRKFSDSPEGEMTGIFLVDIDGTNVKRVPTNIGKGLYAIGKPCWSPDGKKIAFSPGVGDIYVVSLYSKDMRNLTSHEGRPYGEIAWSPDGKKIAFTRMGEKEYGMELHVMNNKGESQMVAKGRCPSWSPDSQKLAFWSGTAVMTTDADGKNQRELVSAVKQPRLANRVISNVYWSPDGKNIFFDGGGGVAVVNAETGDYKELYSGGYCSSVSPNGKEIIFTKRDKIWRAELDKPDSEKILASGKRLELEATWSRDGKKIVFVRDIGKNDMELWVIDSDGSNEKQLTFSTKAAKAREAQKK
jgi:TolB protein